MSAKSIIPSLMYKDAGAAADWLCKAFGFEKKLVVPGNDGKIIHAELTMGSVMIMLGSMNSGTEYSKHIKHPQDIGGETQSPYIVVYDADAIYNSAKENGAAILIDIKTEEYGGRGFTCKDPEGHIWNFGTYDPWQTQEE